MKSRIMMISTHGYVAVQPELGKPDTGGQVLFVLELSKSLARLGYEVDIVTRRFEDQPEREAIGRGVRLLRFPCGGADFIPKETLVQHIPEWVENLIAFARSHAVHYSLLNSHYWDAGVAGQLLAERWDVPHWHTPHSLGVWKRDSMPGTSRELERQYNFRERIHQERRVYQCCTGIAATTAQQRQLLVENPEYDVPQERIALIPPGYDERRFYPVSSAHRAAAKRDLGLEGPIILALGRMARNKGYDLLIHALPSILRRVPEARLLLAVGSTCPTSEEQQMLTELRELAHQLEVSPKVVFRDYIPDAQLPDYYRAADVFALSSRYEPFGMTAVEAMACGTPTVITTHGGLWEEIEWGRDALYSDPEDPEAFGHAICCVLTYPAVAESLARQGAVKARRDYTWSHVARRFLAVVDAARTTSSAFSRFDLPERTEQESQLAVGEGPWLARTSS